MADEGPRTQDSPETRRAWEEPRLTDEEFRNTPEFRRFKRGMRKIMKISKVEMDRRIIINRQK